MEPQNLNQEQQSDLPHEQYVSFVRTHLNLIILILIALIAGIGLIYILNTSVPNEQNVIYVQVDPYEEWRHKRRIFGN